MRRIPAAGALYLLCALLVGTFFVPHITFASSTEEEVKSFFSDIPVMIAIAQCESKFRQFGSDGLPLRGGWGGGMVGVFQIYERVHDTAAKALGHDITTLGGNLAYAKHLYMMQGTDPWNSARSCWGKQAAAQAASDTDVKALEEKIKTLQKLVVQLQELLEKKKRA